jgi:hypothetical protein
MNLKPRLLAVSVAFAIASLLNDLYAQDISSAATFKAAKEMADYVALGFPAEGAEIIADKAYFLDKFNKDYDVTGGKLRLAGTKKKYLVCNEVAKAMIKFAQATTQTDPELIQADWVAASAVLSSELTKLNAAGISFQTKLENELWQKFLNEWLDDVKKRDKKPTIFKQALYQAAFEIRKSALGIQASQDKEAGSKQAVGSATTSSGSSSGGGAGATAAGGYHRADVFHARVMSGIYRHHNRHMNQIERITARR